MRKIAAFLEGAVLSSDTRWRVVPTRANGQPAFGNYRWDQERETFAPRSLSVLTLPLAGLSLSVGAVTLGLGLLSA